MAPSPASRVSRSDPHPRYHPARTASQPPPSHVTCSFAAALLLAFAKGNADGSCCTESLIKQGTCGKTEHGHEEDVVAPCALHPAYWRHGEEL